MDTPAIDEGADAAADAVKVDDAADSPGKKRSVVCRVKLPVVEEATMGGAPQSDVLRPFDEKRGWKGWRSGTLPFGFAADRAIPWVQIEGLSAAPSKMEKAAPEAVLQVRFSRNNTRWTSWFQAAWMGGNETGRAAQESPTLPGDWRGKLEDKGGKILTDEWRAAPSNRMRFGQVRLFIKGDATPTCAGLTALATGQAGFAAELPLVGASNIAPRANLEHIAQFETPEIGHLICSPVSVLMAMRALGTAGERWSVEEVAARVEDPVADIYGNWVHAIQLAAEGGMRGEFAYFASLADLITELQTGRLVVATVRYAEGELTGAAKSASPGHLILIVGYDAESQELLTYDSAAPADSPMPWRYPVREFLTVWLERAALGYIFGD